MAKPKSSFLSRTIDNPAPMALIVSATLFALHLIAQPLIFAAGIFYGFVSFPGSTIFWIISVILGATFLPKLVKKLDAEGPRVLFGDILRFKGVAGRKEFWLKSLSLFLGAAFAISAWAALVLNLYPWGTEETIASIVVTALGYTAIGAVLMSISVPLFVRRLKDTGISGWWYLVVLVINAFLIMTGVFSMFAMLTSVALVLYCGFMPSRPVSALCAAE